ncbi:MAG: hypothetical protein ACRCX2_20405 [Paraclostridium sp.]
MKNTTTSRPLRKSLYMLTEKELINQIQRECIADGVPYKSDEFGNMWSIRFIDKPIFVAHMDTVIGNDINYKSPLLEKDGKLSRPGHVLGADDRAGVNLILNHKHKINFVFTTLEEQGCIGAKQLAGNQGFINDVTDIGGFFIELDRRGSSDILGNVHGYCEQGVVDVLQTVLPHYKDNSGVFTDIDAWTDIRQGVNLSVGYYNAHSSNEYLNIAQFDYLDSKIEELGQIDCSSLKNTYKKPRPTYNSYYERDTSWNRYFANAYDWMDNSSERECQFCGCYEKVTYDYKGYVVCEHCAVGLPEEDLYEIETGYTEPSKKEPAVGELNDEELSRCSNCSTLIDEDESYISIPDWQVCFCLECADLKQMKWK